MVVGYTLKKKKLIIMTHVKVAPNMYNSNFVEAAPNALQALHSNFPSADV